MIWVAADCEFENNLEKKIKNWNKVVGEEDEVLIFGNFYNGNYKELLEKLNGKKILSDYKANPNYNHMTREALKEVGFTRVNTVYSYIVNSERIIHLIPDNTCIERFNEKKMCGASARSITKQKNILENNILSLSYSDWNNEPIDYEQIPILYKNMVAFNQIGSE